MAKDVNGKEVKVGDKVKALTNGGYAESTYTVGAIYEVEELSPLGGNARLRSEYSGEVLSFLPYEIELVVAGKLEGDNMFKFKVGDKVVLKEAGVIGRMPFVDEILNRVSEYGFLEVTEVGCGTNLDGYAIAVEGDYYKRNQLWVTQWMLEYYFKLKEEPKLTPKLIESLDELQVGDYFKDNEGVVRRVKVKDDSFTPIETERNYYYNLEQLIYMGAYKVKVEPYEMVEVVAVKPKLYELVEGGNYVKLERGDVVKFKDGNVHGVHAVDEDDNVSPYCMQFIGEAWWVEAHYFLPENIISINGVNIHEEASEKDPYEGWVEGAKVRCLKGNSYDYIEGSVYTLGYCNYEMGNDFGVLTNAGRVYKYGCLQPEYAVDYVNGDIFKCFELIKE